MLYKEPKPIKKKPIGSKKITVSLPPAVVDDLDFIASTIGLSRSALLSSILAQSLPAVKATVVTLIGAANDAIAESDGDAEAASKRYNAHSKAAIDDFMERVISGGQDDLFNGK